MIDRFEELLQNIGKEFDLEMRPDQNRACAIQIQEGLIVQLETDSAMERLLIASKVVEVPPGKFRENVLKEALKANALPDPCIGIFAYIIKTNQLVLFQRYPFDILTGERVAALLGPFFYTAEKWREAIASGVAAPQIPQLQRPPPGMRP